MSLDDEVNELRKWVKIGHMDRVKELLDTGKPLVDPQRPRRKSVLETAVETGFYSMVELLVEVWPRSEDLDYMLSRAIALRYTEIAKLLVERGADVHDPSFYGVARCYDKELMRIFLDCVDDPCANDKLADAIAAKSRPLLGILREYAEKCPGGRSQLAKALKMFVSEKNPKWVSIALWMGADPRLRVSADKDTQEDPVEGTSALEDAFMYGEMDVIRCFKLDPSKDDPTALLSYMPRYMPHLWIKVVDHLLQHGAQINDQPNGGCSLLLTGFHDMYMESRQPLLTGLGEQARYAIEGLIDRGARLVPADEGEYRHIRDGIVFMKHGNWRGFVKKLAAGAEPEVIYRILKTSRMRRELGLNVKQIMAELKIRPRES